MNANLPQKINPESAMLQQVDGHWQKLAALLIFKLAGGRRVTITTQDMQALAANYAPGIPCVLTRGKPGCIELSLVTQAEAIRLAEFDRQTRSMK